MWLTLVMAVASAHPAQAADAASWRIRPPIYAASEDLPPVDRARERKGAAMILGGLATIGLSWGLAAYINSTAGEHCAPDCLGQTYGSLALALHGTGAGIALFVVGVNHVVKARRPRWVVADAGRLGVRFEVRTPRTRRHAGLGVVEEAGGVLPR